MRAESLKSTAEAEIREVVDAWLGAVRARDVEAIASHYASDIVSFDAIGQLQFKGRDAYKRHWQACLDMCPGAMVFEIHDLVIAATDDVAFCHCLNRCGGTDERGDEKVGWMRMTAGYRKMNGRWMVTHEHFSAPFDMESGKALLGLEP